MFCQYPAYLGARSMRGGTAQEDEILGKGWHSSALILGVDVPQVPGDHGGGGLRGFL